MTEVRGAPTGWVSSTFRVLRLRRPTPHNARIIQTRKNRL